MPKPSAFNQASHVYMHMTPVHPAMCSVPHSADWLGPLHKNNLGWYVGMILYVVCRYDSVCGMWNM
jgi:hypothetical protein